MKKLITITTIFLGLFLFVGITQAAEANLLQPAATITYNEDLTVTGTGRFNSIYIGSEGEGGVTFFNGTIVNIGETTPVTFGDDVRIDGQIWGGPNKGNANDQGIKIADALLPGLSNANDLGSNNLKWDDLYIDDIHLDNRISLNSPKEYVLSIPGVTCVNGQPFVTDGSCKNSSQNMLWNLALPNGAEVTQFSGYLYNNFSTQSICSLYRLESSSSPNLTPLARITHPGSSTAWQYKKDDTIQNAKIDNSKYSYYIDCTGAPIPDDIKVSSLQIKYQKSYID